MFDLTALKRPTTPEEAVRDLLETEGTGLYVAGGTVVVPAASPSLDFLVDLTRLGLDHIRVEQTDAGETLAVGAMVRIADLAASEILTGPALGEIRSAARGVGTHTVRNSATVGGNLSVAHYPSDLPPVFLVLDATVAIQGSDGLREVALTDLYEKRSEVHRRGDLLIEARVPRAREGLSCGFEKTGRTKVDVAIVNCAASLAVEGGKITHASIALNGIGARPVTADQVAASLVGREPSAGLFAQAGGDVSAGLTPREDHRASADYRRRLARVVVKRALMRAAGLLEREPA